MSTAARARRVLMVHWDGAGNLPPQRALARALIRRGHEVSVLTHDSVADGVRADGAAFHRLATARQYSMADRRAPDEQVMFLVAEVCGSPALAADFRTIVDRVRPDICLIDCMLVSVLRAAADLPIPRAALYHTAYEPAFFEPLMPLILGQMGISAPDLTYQGLLEAAPRVLVFSYPAFSPHATFAPCLEHVGPIREPAPTADWPRRRPDRPFVLASLSTSFQHQRETLQRICDALAPLPVEALVTTGPNIAAEGLSVGGGVEARAFVPHDQVASFADLLITHAGHGTVMAGAGAGVPMLCLPMGRDQHLVAGRVEALGLGRTLSSEAHPGEIGRAVLAMLGDASLKAACRSFASGVSRFGDLERAADLVEQAM